MLTSLYHKEIATQITCNATYLQELYTKCATDTTVATVIATPANIPLLEKTHEDCQAAATT